jgi:hypothetical protein
MALGEAMGRTWEEEDLGDGLVAKGSGSLGRGEAERWNLDVVGNLPDRLKDTGLVRWKVSHVECYLSI